MKFGDLKTKQMEVKEMVCEKCQKDYGKIIIRLRDKNGEQTFCPNCLAFTVSKYLSIRIYCTSEQE